MGEARRDALRVGFDRAIKLEFHGAKVEWHQGEGQMGNMKLSGDRLPTNGTKTGP